MREKFELCVKVVGLALLSLGILLMLNAILLFFFNPFHNIPSSLLSSSPLPRQFQDQMADEMWNTRVRTTIYVLLSGIVQAAMGAYLMRSDNLIIRLCYPRSNGGMQPVVASGSLSADRALSDPPGQAQGPGSHPETQYAPPGYFQ